MTVTNVVSHYRRKELDKEKAEFEAIEREKIEGPKRLAAEKKARQEAERIVEEQERQLDMLFVQVPQHFIDNCTHYNGGMTRTELVAAIKEAWIQFQANIAEDGIRLTDVGLARMKTLLAKSIAEGAVSPADFSDLVIGFLYLDELGAFTDGVDIIRPAVKQVERAPVAAPVDYAAEIESAPTSHTREGEKALRKMANEAAVEAHRDIFTQFIGFIRDTYGVPFTVSEQQAVVDWCLDRGGINARTLDAARVAVLGLIDPMTQLARELENWHIANPDASAYQQRAWYAQRRKELGL